MPTYDAICQKCRHAAEYFSSVEKRNEVPACPVCKKPMARGVTIPSIRPDLNDFSTENGGKGRFNKQLMTYVTSQKDAIKKAEARGWEVLDKD
jgi:putative FmdB family regulatory protein